MKDQAVILSFSFEQEPDAFSLLERGGCEPILLPEKDRKGWTEKEFIIWWRGLNAPPAGLLMGADIKLGADFVRAATGLRCVSLNCAGSDHLDLAAFRAAGIPVCNVPRRNFDAVADFIFGQILSLMRRIPQGDRTIRAGRWCEGVERGMAVSRKTLGIVGFGAIGQAVAKRARGFDMEIIVSSRTEDPALAEAFGARYVRREELFSLCDILVPTCPLAPETYHLIGDKSLPLMKKSAVIVNASRGGVIDTRALYNALESGALAGAALDVFEEEPLTDSPLFSLQNVLLTPHMAGLADREIREVAMRAAENMLTLLRGEQTRTEL